MKFIATVAPMPKNPDDLIPQFFTTVYIDAEDEEKAKENIESRGHCLWSIDDSESARGRLITALCKLINETKDLLKHHAAGIRENEIWNRAQLETLRRVLRVAQGLESVTDVASVHEFRRSATEVVTILKDLLEPGDFDDMEVDDIVECAVDEYRNSTDPVED